MVATEQHMVAKEEEMAAEQQMAAKELEATVKMRTEPTARAMAMERARVLAK